MTADTLTCETCGRRYKLTKSKLPASGKGSISCRCGKLLVSWNGSVLHTADLIQPEAEKPSR